MYKRNGGAGGGKDWNLVWLDEYRGFLKLKPGEPFSVDKQVVISFLIELKRRGKKAWQRLQAVKAIMMFGRDLRLSTDHLEEIGAKLKILVDREKAEADSAPDIKEMAGKINPNEPEIVQRLRKKIRLKHQSLNTEKSYVKTINQFIRRFHLQDDPQWNRVTRCEIELFLTEMAVEGNVSASTQNVAFSALRYVMVEVLERSFDCVDAMRAKGPSQLPLCLSQDEVARLLAQFTGQELLIARLLYGCGFRLGDCVSLRVKDIDFELNQIVVRDSKGMKSRVAILPKMACEDLRKQIAARRIEHQRDLDEGPCGVKSPLDRIGEAEQSRPSKLMLDSLPPEFLALLRSELADRKRPA